VLDHPPPSAEACAFTYPGWPVPIGCYARMLLFRNFQATTQQYTDF